VDEISRNFREQVNLQDNLNLSVDTQKALFTRTAAVEPDLNQSYNGIQLNKHLMNKSIDQT